MKRNFAIAYANENGRDFNGIPWIFDDLNNEEECILKVKEMINCGLKNVIPFEFSQRRRQNLEEIIDWEYVKTHKIDDLDNRNPVFEQRKDKNI